MKYLIIGGTGTLGTTLMTRLAGHEVTSLSRDELKQQELRARFPDVRFVLGDIRDRSSLQPYMAGVDAVFHVAALKHVDVLEKNPAEAIKTNVQGTINVAEAAMEAGVKNVVFSSTDKAVAPINVYGMTKGISERYLLGLNERQDKTRFSVFRWGNVMGSRGSVIHSFARSLREEGGVRITDPRMTRFWIHIDDAVDFMLTRYATASTVDVMIPPMKSALVVDLARAVGKAVGKREMTIATVGMRPGEKIHEVLCEGLSSDICPKYSEKELDAMVARVIAC